MLLVSKRLVAQQMTLQHLAAIRELLCASSFCAYFNSWCASASVNHFHCHLIDELPPVGHLPLASGPLVLGQRVLQPQGFTGFCYVFTWQQIDLIDAVVRAMQSDNQPHNFMFTSRLVYVFSKPLQRPERSLELYPETVGGPELVGSFTVYKRGEYDGLTLTDIEELVRINTAPLPSRLLRRGGVGDCIDDGAVQAPSVAPAHGSEHRDCAAPADVLPPRPAVPMSVSLDRFDWRSGRGVRPTPSAASARSGGGGFR